MSETIKIVMGIILIVVAFILFPIVLTASDTIGSANISNLTGLDSMRTIGPTILFVAMVFSGGFLGFTGFKRMRGRR